MKREIIQRRPYLMAVIAVLLLTSMYGFTATSGPVHRPAAGAPPAAETPSNVEEEGEPPFPFIISGYIRDPNIEPGELIPIPGATVWAVKSATEKFPPSGQPTDAEGKYHIIVTEEIKYTIEVQHPSYNTNDTSSVTVDYSTSGKTEYTKNIDNMTHNGSGDPVRVVKTNAVYYKDKISDALNAAANNEKIQIRATTTPFIETLTCTKPIFLNGGFNSNFSGVTGLTAIKGDLTLSHPSSTVTVITDILIQP